MRIKQNNRIKYPGMIQDFLDELTKNEFTYFQLSCENCIFAFSHENNRNLYYLSSNKSEIIGQYERGRAIKARPLYLAYSIRSITYYNRRRRDLYRRYRSNLVDNALLLVIDFVVQVD